MTRDEIDRAFTAFSRTLDYFPKRPYDGTHLYRGLISRWKSDQIDKYVRAFHLQEPGEASARRVRIDRNVEVEVIILKELTWYYVINSTATVTQRYGQRAMVHDLFCIFIGAATSRNRDDWLIFPKSYQDALAQLPPSSKTGARDRVRLVVDLIASMNEQQVVTMYQRLTGTSLGSVLDPSRL